MEFRAYYILEFRMKNIVDYYVIFTFSPRLRNSHIGIADPLVKVTIINEQSTNLTKAPAIFDVLFFSC